MFTETKVSYIYLQTEISKKNLYLPKTEITKSDFTYLSRKSLCIYVVVSKKNISQSLFIKKFVHIFHFSLLS